MDILSEIYTGNYRAEYEPTEEYRRQRKERIRILDRVQKTMGDDFVDELESCEGAFREEGEICAFRHGFRLGALLMLELLYNTPQSM